MQSSPWPDDRPGTQSTLLVPIGQQGPARPELCPGDARQPATVTAAVRPSAIPLTRTALADYLLSQTNAATARAALMTAMMMMMGTATAAAAMDAAAMEAFRDRAEPR
jgi:hypothetical protein